MTTAVRPFLHTAEKCAHCHLFVESNDEESIQDGCAEYIHLHRGDEADEAIDNTHEAKASGLIATLDTWKRYGPPAMRARFVDDDHPQQPDAIGVRLLAGTPWSAIDTDSDPTPVWTIKDSRAANAEGWDLFDCDGSENGPLQLCKIDDPETWAEDHDIDIAQQWDEDSKAWVYVWTNPSDLHAKALAVLKALNPTEYDAIERWVAKNS